MDATRLTYMNVKTARPLTWFTEEMKVGKFRIVSEGIPDPLKRVPVCSQCGYVRNGDLNINDGLGSQSRHRRRSDMVNVDRDATQSPPNLRGLR